MSFALLKEDQIFAQRYRVIRNIAAGGMGAVYEVEHRETARRCALKVMLPHILLSDDLRERFKLEARVTASLGSEFIVDVFDAGVDEETELPFLVMELLDGFDLSHVLHDRGPLPASDVVTYLHQVALALRKTHAASIVHRDLKPENLILTYRDDGSPKMKVLDFGISKVVADSATRNQTLTIGTPLYMSPEQFLGHVSSATDIYALGMIAYTLLVGLPYWSEENESTSSSFALSSMIMKGPSEAATTRAYRFGVELPPSFDEWFMRVTAQEPEARPTALEAIEGLASVFSIPFNGKTRSVMPSALDAAALGARSNTGVRAKSGPLGKQAISNGTPEVAHVIGRATTLSATAGENLLRSVPPKRGRLGLFLGAGLGALLIVGALVFFISKSGKSTEAVAKVPSDLRPAALVPQLPVSVATAAAASPVVAPSSALVAVDTAQPAASSAPKSNARTDSKKNAAPASQDKKSVYSRL